MNDKIRTHTEVELEKKNNSLKSKKELLTTLSALDKKRNDFITLFESLSPEEQNQITKNSMSYNAWAKDRSDVPHSYVGLIRILGGERKTQQGGYIKALIESKNKGKEYIKNGRNLDKKNEFIKLFNSSTPEQQQKIIGNSIAYTTWTKNRTDFPKSYNGLIAVLGGKPGCLQSGYIKALIKSEEDGKRYFENWEKQNNKTLQEKRNDFIILFESLSLEEQNQITKNPMNYKYVSEERDNIPKTYPGLISLLLGNPLCQKGDYVKALLKSEEDGKRYFENWEANQNILIRHKESGNINSQNINHKDTIVKVYNNLSFKQRSKIFRNKENYIARAQNRYYAPSTYEELIELLGGNNQCCTSKYVIALMEGWGDKYFQTWQEAQNKKQDTHNKLKDF